MRSIATVNFKGGVGKTTITWLLAKYLSEIAKKKVLVFDIDAQMSLTLAVQLQENGAMFDDFEMWYENTHIGRNRTILNALERFDIRQRRHFDFPIDYTFIFQMTDNLHFVPSVVDLYWLELEVFDRANVQNFIYALLDKIRYARGFQYDYVFFDCPPNFTALSYSVLNCVDLILIPLNPDVFASRGVKLMLEGLRYRIAPWPDPDIAVFMNKARFYRGNLTQETMRYWNEAKSVCEQMQGEGVSIYPLDVFISEKMDIKRAIPGGYFPNDYINDFQRLYENIDRILQR